MLATVVLRDDDPDPLQRIRHQGRESVWEKGELGYGDVWTWPTIDADTKLAPTWCVGKRAAADGADLVADLAGRLANRVRLTTDGLGVHDSGRRGVR